MPTEQDFRTQIRGLMREAQTASASFVDINSGQGHHAVGGYPGPDHRIPVCCQVMKADIRVGDEVLPPNGQGGSLTIRYKLPRR
jgi:5-methylcytosine-specific restriction protein A